MNFKKSIGLLLLLLMIPFWALAQNVTVKGIVTDTDGGGIPGVSVLLAGSSNGAITDIDGNYQITVPADGKLVYSFIGYQSQTINVNGKSSINVTLLEDAQALGEVVVVGYGTMKKSDITGSVVSVNTEDMMKRVPTNVGQGLQGAAPGVIVTMQDGAPESKAQIRIRGVGTINGSAAPLFVVDGIAVGDNADFVSPNDIESIDVLKDASATAIYGSKGANGVIMITTKHGKDGHATLNISADMGLQTLPYTLDVCDVDQYAANLRQARINDNQVNADGSAMMWNPVWSAAYDGKRKAIDWQKEMTRAAWKQNYNVSTSGGTETTQYNASVGFLRNEGLVVNTQYQRITARANAQTQINKYISFGADVSFVHSDRHGSNVSVGNFGNLSSLRDYAFACPTMDFITSNVVTYSGVPAGTYVSPNVVNPDGTYGEVAGGKNFNDGMWGTTLGNMYAKQMEQQGRKRSNRALASAYITVSPVKGLTWKTLASYDYTSNSDQTFSGGVKRVNYIDGKAINVTQGPNDAYYNPRENNDYQFSLGNNDAQTLYIENTLTYNWSNDVHNLTIMLGNEVSRWYGQWVSGSAIGFDSANSRDLGLTTQPTRRNASGALNLESRSISYFGRLNYSLLDRYLVTATVRRDGSSNFGAGNRWGTFPSAAIGWRISEEPFMKNQNVVSNLKLRAGWGQTGNSGGTAEYSALGYALDGRYVYYGANDALGLGTGTPNVITGFYPLLRDPELKWETNEQINVGLDAAFLNGEIVFGIDYFIRTSKDLLLDREIRSTSGYPSIRTNYGEIENKGIEFSLGWNHRFSKDFSLNAMLTGSTISNKIKKMTEPVYKMNSDSSSNADPTGDGSNTGAVGASDGYHWDNHSISKEGYAVGSFYGYRTDGIIRNQTELDEYIAKFTSYDDNGNATLNINGTPSIGDYRWKDLNGDNKINEQDMDILGNGFPSLSYGLNLGAQYKSFDFSVQMHGVLGQKIYSYSAMRLTNMFSSDDGCAPNILKESAANAWSPSNPNGTEARLSFLDKNYNMRGSDAWVKNGDFLKISNVQIGYTLPKKVSEKWGLANFRVYAAVQNLLCISGYNKYGDPECGQGSVLFTGLDTGRYPMPRTFMAGVNVTFGHKAKAKKVEPVIIQQPVEVEKVVEKVVEKPVVKEVVKEINKGIGVYVVNFAVDNYELTDEAKAELDKVSGTVEVVAYASPEGAADYNQQLSENRANAVAEYLKSKGINVLRTTGVGSPNNASNRIAIVTVK